MHEMQTIVIEDPIVWASVSLSVTWATVVVHLSATSTTSHLATCYLINH